MADPIAQFIPTTTNIFDDDASTTSATDRKQRNIIRTHHSLSHALLAWP